jgi:hypothetical protein
MLPGLSDHLHRARTIRRSSAAAATTHVAPGDEAEPPAQPLAVPEPSLPHDQTAIDYDGHALRSAHRDALRDSRLGMMASVADAGLEKIARALTLARGLVMVLMKPESLTDDETAAIHHTLDRTIADVDATAQQTRFERMPMLSGAPSDAHIDSALPHTDARSEALGRVTVDGHALSLADIRLAGTLSPLTAPLKTIARIIGAARNDVHHMQRALRDVLDRLTRRIHDAIAAAVATQQPAGGHSWGMQVVQTVRASLQSARPAHHQLLRRPDAQVLLTLIT